MRRTRNVLFAGLAAASLVAAVMPAASADHRVGHAPPPGGGNGGGGPTVVAPTVTENITGTLGNNGWYTSDVTLSWTVTGTSPTTTGCTTTVINADQGATSYTCTATNSVGTASKTVSIKRDVTAPTVRFTATPGDTYEGESSTTPACSADDGSGSGILGDCSISGGGTAVGDYTLTAGATDNAGNTATAVTHAYSILADTTAPSITPGVTGTLSNGWYTSDVEVSFNVQEPETPTSLVKDAGCATANITADQQSVTYSCGASSKGGTTPAVTRSVQRDATAPHNIHFTSGPADGSQHYVGEVHAAACDAEDATSGLASCNVSASEADANGVVTLTATATDVAGNRGTATRTYTLLQDTTPPTVVASIAPGAVAGNDGWYRSNVTVIFTVTDEETPSSVVLGDGCDGGAVSANTDSAGQPFSCSATSLGGSNSDSITVKRDANGPTGITFANMSSDFGATPAPTCDATDAHSGLARCTVSTADIGAAAGTYQVTATATDNAGNTSNLTGTYTVASWNIVGFKSPVTMDSTKVNVIKAGSTVPLKFNVYAGAAPTATTPGVGEQTTNAAVTGFSATLVRCDSTDTPTVVPVESTNTTGLRHDGTQFIYNWKSGGTGCYKVTLTLADGSKIVADFKANK